MHEWGNRWCDHCHRTGCGDMHHLGGVERYAIVLGSPMGPTPGRPLGGRLRVRTEGTGTITLAMLCFACFVLHVVRGGRHTAVSTSSFELSMLAFSTSAWSRSSTCTPPVKG